MRADGVDRGDDERGWDLIGLAKRAAIAAVVAVAVAAYLAALTAVTVAAYSPGAIFGAPPPCAGD